MVGYRPEIVLVDDDPLALQALRSALEKDYTLHPVSDPEAAEALFRERSIDLALLDLHLSDRNGRDVLDRWKGQYPELDVVFCSGESRIEQAIECLRHGAADYVVKPFRKEDLRLIVQRVLEKRELKRRVERLDPLVHPHPVEFIGSSAACREVMDKVRLLRGQHHLNVLILGESGTGKEVVARLLHQQEGDAERPFVVVNTPAIPASLMEAELFGVEKGAYTDAKSSRAGKFELADGGDVFLDEIGDLPFETQAKLLRTLQERHIERVGSQRIRKVRFRAVSATNQPFAELVARGRFREDLMYRLSDMVLWLPPLRERRADIPELARHFVAKYSRGNTQPELSPTALRQLSDYDWPGNVRQLESTIKRALVFNRGGDITGVEIFDPSRSRLPITLESRPTETYETRLARFEREVFEEALRKNVGDRAAACRELGLSRATFYRKLNQLRLGDSGSAGL